MTFCGVVFKETASYMIKRITQEHEIKTLFIRRSGEWIPLPEIMKHAAQYNARIHELRTDHGMIIENKKEKVNGTWHSWYRYMPSPDLFGAETFNRNSGVNLPGLY